MRSATPTVRLMRGGEFTRRQHTGPDSRASCGLRYAALSSYSSPSIVRWLPRGPIRPAGARLRSYPSCRSRCSKGIAPSRDAARRERSCGQGRFSDEGELEREEQQRIEICFSVHWACPTCACGQSAQREAADDQGRTVIF
jgi:hypothetical protein